MKVMRYNYRVQVSRMIFTPLSDREFPLYQRPHQCHVVVRKVIPSSCVTASTRISVPTPLSMRRIRISGLRVIAVTHY
jgi:hypothetical protein